MVLPEGFNRLSPDALPAWGGPVGTGVIRARPEDFRVSEIPLLAPSGEGEHSWLHVEKTGSNTQWVARQLARFAGVTPGAVSYAGLKDRHAVTDQWFSVHLPGMSDPDWQSLSGDDGFRVLSHQRHRRKLKTGALAGNRFVIRVACSSGDPEQVEQRLRQLQSGGLPNYFGPQRFGRDGDNLHAAAALFATPKKRVPRAKRGIYLSAVRSALFNRVLSARVEDNSWNTIRQGEAVQLDGRSACFVVDRVDDSELDRLAKQEIHPTGPLYGDGEPLCEGEARAFEQAVLSHSARWLQGLSAARMEPARRSLRVVPGEFTWQRLEQDAWQLAFTLPAGSYATSLLAEVFTLEDGSCPQ